MKEAIASNSAHTLKSTIKVPSLSKIKSSISQPEEKKEVVEKVEEKIIENKNVTFEGLKEAWAGFLEYRKNISKPYEIVILNQEISLTGTQINLNLTNPVQLEQLNDFRVELIGYLRKRLQNYDLEINPVVTIAEEKKMIYTSAEKFNYLAAKNPSLLELKKRLGLDLDY